MEKHGTFYIWLIPLISASKRVYSSLFSGLKQNLPQPSNVFFLKLFRIVFDMLHLPFLGRLFCHCFPERPFFFIFIFALFLFYFLSLSDFRPKRNQHFWRQKNVRMSFPKGFEEANLFFWVDG